MNEEIEQMNYPLPDPAWDYYMTWCKLHRAKAQVKEALNFLRDCEIANPESDQTARAFIDNAITTLQQALPPDEPT